MEEPDCLLRVLRRFLLMACRVRPGSQHLTTHDKRLRADFHCLQVGKYLSRHHNCGLQRPACVSGRLWVHLKGFPPASARQPIRMCDSPVFPGCQRLTSSRHRAYVNSNALAYLST